ncbi:MULTISPECIES: DsbA family oxidoreductase [Pseudoalteromonas]|uniref:2-hydroxychromene-2-carboxylate isomerase n=1 Tax=Pseudoalteromonas amylolytica TaxID=1859457 RepID=A0A1S1MQA8_9GAMM|nr:MULTISPECIES: DsbA family oxidoreductase [Pseudoalteromonas]OHU84231.1 2-hydroxychromene-2-carboxylate isomerase [Pseudoalteromonas sp. JW3]OHU87228.1 2-hydroxychromene-2-carboxylate isomerase [Pseudoalteromonas amylolytica]
MAKTKINIDIVSDVVCPWCVIGYGRLQAALANFDTKFAVNIVWHPFELNPSMPKEGENLRQHLSKKYGTTSEGSIRARAMLTEEGKKVGFRFNYFDEMKMLNTHQCHQLMHWAKESNSQNQLAEALFEHFFSKKGTFTEPELIHVVEKVGLNSLQAQSVLANNSYSEEVKLIEKHWHQRGIHGVPLFIFNGEQVLSGAQEVATFEGVLNQYLK